jgi:hypothetical protein
LQVQNQCALAVLVCCRLARVPLWLGLRVRHSPAVGCLVHFL